MKKIYIQELNINGWKGIQNNVGISFLSNVRRNKDNERTINENIIMVDKKKIYNKVGLTGSNAYGKSSFLESFAKVFQALNNVQNYNYHQLESLFSSFVNNKQKQLI